MAIRPPSYGARGGPPGSGLNEAQVKAEVKPYAQADRPNTLIESADLAEAQRLPAADAGKWLKWNSAGEALENTDAPSADELPALAALPPTADHQVGDVVNVNGVLWRLAAGTADPHVHHGTLASGSAAADTPDAGYLGDTTFSFDRNPPGNVRLWIPTALATEATLFVEYHRGPAWDELELVRTASVAGGRTRYGLAADEANRLDYDFESGYVGDGFTVSAYSDAARQNAVRIVANANRWVLVVDPSKTGRGGGDDDAASAAPAWHVEGQIESGALRHLVVVNPGAGYISDPQVQIDAPPAGGVQATATVTRASGAISELTITNAGAGYVDRPNVRLVGGGGGGAVVQASIGTAVTSAAPSAQGAWGAWTNLVTLPALAAGQAGRALVAAQIRHESGLGTSGGDRLIIEARLVRRRGAVDTVLRGGPEYGPRQMNPGGATSRQFAVESSVAVGGMASEDDVQAGDVIRLDSRVVLQRTSGDAVTLAAPPLVNSLSVTAFAGGAAAGAGGQGQQSPGDYATRAFVQSQDALTLLAIDNTVRSLFRRAQWARAWIRAADAATALAGVAAATWTNQGAGTPPTGASWDIGTVASSAIPLWELTALVSPTAGDPDDWTFGTWGALHVTAVNTQYSADGATGWHAAPRVGGDRYERHFTGGAWGPAVPLYAADELVWANLISTDIYHATTHWLPPIALIDLPARMQFDSLNLMRIRMETRVAGGRVVAGDAVVNPDFFLSAPYADRATATPQPEFYWQIRLNAAGLSAITGGLHHGNGPAANGEDAGLTLQWIRPPSPSHAGEAASLRVVYLKNLRTTYRLMIEAL